MLVYLLGALYSLVVVSGLLAIPAIKGWHLERYKKEWTAYCAEPEWLLELDAYIGWLLIWPTFIAMCVLMGGLYYSGRGINNLLVAKLRNYGKSIAQKQSGIKALENKRDVRKRELKEAEEEIERFLLEGKVNVQR